MTYAQARAKFRKIAALREHRYGLHQRILAADGELPFLRRANGTATPDITLTLSGAPPPPAAQSEWYRSAALTIDKTLDGAYLVRFEDNTSFTVTPNGRSIALVNAPSEYTKDDVAAYALGPVLAIALHLQGAVLLHASAVLMNARALLFAGDAGSGKSTIAAALHRLGHPVLADDVVEVVEGGALAAAPAIRLWPDALDALFGSAAAFPDRAPSWPKKIVATESVDDGPHDIAAILFLESRDEEPRIERLAPLDAWQRLTANVYTAPLPGGARNAFELTTSLANRIPMYALSAPPLTQIEQLSALLEALP